MIIKTRKVKLKKEGKVEVLMSENISEQYKRLRKNSKSLKTTWPEFHNFQQRNENRTDTLLVSNALGATAIISLSFVLPLVLADNSLLSFISFGIAAVVVGVFMYKTVDTYHSFDVQKKVWRSSLSHNWATAINLWEVLNVKEIKQHIPNALLDRAREELPAVIAAAEVLDWADKYPSKKLDPNVIEAQQIIEEAEVFLGNGLKDAYLTSLEAVEYVEAEKVRPQRAVKPLETTKESPFADEVLAAEWKEKMKQI